MKKIVLTIPAIMIVFAAISQTSKKPANMDLTRAGDHLMVQLGSEKWLGSQDSISKHSTGIARVGNVYLMMDKPFKGNPKISVAFGVGISTSNEYFKKMGVDVKATSTKLPFTALDSLNHYKKYKLTTSYLEVPIELRFCADPYNDRKSLKFALGAKVGTLLSVHTKGKTLQDKNDKVVTAVIAKENSKHYFNGTRLSLTGRIGYGNFSVFGSYQVNTFLKDGVGPDIRPLQFGICLSGL